MSSLASEMRLLYQIGNQIVSIYMEEENHFSLMGRKVLDTN